MRDFEIGKLLQLMGGPMAEIQRPDGTAFKGISGGGDVADMEFGAAMDQVAQGIRLELPERPGVLFQTAKERGIANTGDFDSLRVTGAFVASGESREQIEVIQHRIRRSERPDEVFLSERVDAVFHTHSGVALAQGRGGNAQVTDSAMSGGGGEARHIQQSAAADAEQKVVAINVVTFDFGMDFGDVNVGVLGALAPFHDHWGTNEGRSVGVGIEIGGNLGNERGPGGGERFIEDQQCFARGGGVTGQTERP